jgi:hypothetical protein
MYISSEPDGVAAQNALSSSLASDADPELGGHWGQSDLLVGIPELLDAVATELRSNLHGGSPCR